jgi:hypothetical protein
LSSNSSTNSSNQSNDEILKALDTNNTSSQSIVENTQSTVDATNTQTTTLASDINTNITNLNNNIIAENEKVYNENVTENNNLITINSNIEKLESDLVNIIATLVKMDSSNTTQLSTVLQELVNMHISLNNLGTLFASSLSSEEKTVSFSGTSPVSVSNNQNTQVNKRANGGVVDGNTIVGDGEGNNAGYELAELPDGRIIQVGTDGWTLMNLPKGTKIISHQDSQKILHGGGIKSIPKFASGNYDPTSKDFLNQINTQSDTQVSVANKIAEIQKQYTSDLASGVSDSQLIQHNIDLAVQDILLANDTISQFKSKEAYFVGDTDSLNKLAEYEQKQNTVIQNAQKKILEYAQQYINSLTTINDAKEKQLETENKLVGSIYLRPIS